MAIADLTRCVSVAAADDATPSYDVFISYARATDFRLARRLENFLEQFHELRLPDGQTLPQLSVCVDGTDFTMRNLAGAGSEMVHDAIEAVIDHYLARSRLLLVLCSSGAVRSRYVEHEIDWFREHRSVCDLLLAVTDGDPVGHPAVVFPTAVRPRPDRTWPWYDMRRTRWWERWWPGGRFDESRIRLAADVLQKYGFELAELYPPWRREQRQRWWRQAAAAAGAFIAIAVATGWGYNNFRHWIEERTLSYSRHLAQQSTEQIRQDPELALLLAREAVDTLSQAGIGRDDLGVRRALRRALGASHVRLRLAPAKARDVRQATWNADGTRVLTLADDGSRNDRLRVWDAASGRPIGRSFIHGGGVLDALLSPDGRRAVTLGQDRRAWIWREHAGRWSRHGEPIALGDSLLRGAMRADGRQVALAEMGTSIQVWNLDAAAPAFALRIPTPGRAVTAIDYSPSGGELVWGAGGAVYRYVFDEHRRQDGPVSTQRINGVRFTPDGARVVVARDNRVDLWTPGSADMLEPFARFPSAVTAAAVRMQGDLLLAASDDGTVSIMALADGQPVSTLRGHDGGVHTAAFSPDGRRVLSASSDGTARIWAVEPEAVQVVELEHQVGRLAFDRRGERLAIADRAAFTTRIWDPHNGYGGAVVRSGTGAPRALAFSDDGAMLLIGAADHSAQPWDSRGGTAIGQPLGMLAAAVEFADIDPAGRHALIASQTDAQAWALPAGERPVVELRRDEPILAARFTPAGDAMAVVGQRGLELWPLAGGAPRAFTLDDGAPITTAAFSRDRHVAAAAAGNRVWLWDLRAAEQPARQVLQPEAVSRIAVSGTGSVLAAAGEAHVMLWNVGTAAALGAPVARDGVSALAFDDGGTLLAIGGDSGRVDILQTATGQRIGRVETATDGGPGRSGRIQALAFSPGGEFLAIGGDGAVARIFRREHFAPVEQLLALAAERTTRPLSASERAVYLQSPEL